MYMCARIVCSESLVLIVVTSVMCRCTPWHTQTVLFVLNSTTLPSSLDQQRLCMELRSSTLLQVIPAYGQFIVHVIDD